MLKITVKQDSLYFGADFAIEFQRTLRIPDDDKQYPLPPGLGRFPIRKVDDYPDTVPQHWREHGGVFIPMYQREAMWLNFRPLKRWLPHAVKVAIGKVNAISGKDWDEKLKRSKDDYVVAPPQPWLDGINAGDGFIKQFVAMPLGMGYTVEGQVTGKEEHGGVQIIVFAPKKGKFKEPEHQPVYRSMSVGDTGAVMAKSAMPASMSLLGHVGAGAEMGLAAGGKMKQKIYPDPHGLATWDTNNTGRVFVHIVNSMLYREITGQEPPATPVSAKTYTTHGLPWFDLYDEHKADITAPDVLKDVKTVKEKDAEHGFDPQQDDDSVEVPEDKIVKYKVPPDSDEIRDGDW